MPHLEDIHIMEMDRATSKLEVVRKNPTRQFVKMTDRGMALYTWQNGHYFDTGGNYIPNPDETVPVEFRRQIEENPVTMRDEHAVKVAWTCKFCGVTMNDSEQENHLIEHVNATLQAAGRVGPPATSQPQAPPAAAVSTKEQETERPVTAKNIHRG